MGRGDGETLLEEVTRVGLDTFLEGPLDQLYQQLTRAEKALAAGDLKAVARNLFSDQATRKLLAARGEEPAVSRLFQQIARLALTRDEREPEQFYGRIYLACGIEGAMTLFAAREQPGAPIHAIPDLKSNITACGIDLGDHRSDYFHGITLQEIASSHPEIRCQACKRALTHAIRNEQLPRFTSEEIVPSYCRNAFNTYISSEVKKTEAVERTVVGNVAVEMLSDVKRLDCPSPDEMLESICDSAREVAVVAVAARAADLFSNRNNKLELACHFGIHPDSVEAPFLASIERSLDQYRHSPTGWPSKHKIEKLIFQATDGGDLLDHEIVRCRFLAYVIADALPIFAETFLKNYGSRPGQTPGSEAMRAIFLELCS